MTRLPFVADDGGRAAAGFRGEALDCVTRSISIATGVPYREVYDALYERALGDRAYMAKLQLKYGANARKHVSPRATMAPRVYRPYLAELGFAWTPTMRIGVGCTVHLAGDLLDLAGTDGPIIAKVSKHLTAIVDGTIRDTYDPSRDGTRCVYGYYADSRLG